MTPEKFEELTEKGKILVENNQEFVYLHSEQRIGEWITVELQLRESGIRVFSDEWHEIISEIFRSVS